MESSGFLILMFFILLSLNQFKLICSSPLSSQQTTNTETAAICQCQCCHRSPDSPLKCETSILSIPLQSSTCSISSPPVASSLSILHRMPSTCNPNLCVQEFNKNQSMIANCNPEQDSFFIPRCITTEQNSSIATTMLPISITLIICISIAISRLLSFSSNHSVSKSDSSDSVTSINESSNLFNHQNGYTNNYNSFKNPDKKTVTFSSRVYDNEHFFITSPTKKKCNNDKLVKKNPSPRMKPPKPPSPSSAAILLEQVNNDLQRDYPENNLTNMKSISHLL